MENSNNNILEIAIDNITVLTDQNDRKTFDQQTIIELADSIKIHGIIQNLLVRKNGKPNHYELIAGERRIRGAKLAGLESVPCCQFY